MPKGSYVTAKKVKGSCLSGLILIIPGSGRFSGFSKETGYPSASISFFRASKSFWNVVPNNLCSKKFVWLSFNTCSIKDIWSLESFTF